MKLDELMETFSSCSACISISGLCDDYFWNGFRELQAEPWYRKAGNREVKRISVIGSDRHSFEPVITLE